MIAIKELSISQHIIQ